ncbi:hypothetical protein OKW28_005500 [Paraburkholderia sp. 40]
MSDNARHHRSRTGSKLTSVVTVYKPSPFNRTVASDLWVILRGNPGRFTIGQLDLAPVSRILSYFGLNPCVYQTGAQPARHGRISKRGRSYARAMLVEAAWSAAQSAGPLRAFFLHIRDRRGQQIAAVATARKIAVMVWYVLTRNEAFAWDRPALTTRKNRSLELRAGMPARRGGPKGSAAAYNLKSVRDQERAMAEQAERAYHRLFSRWKQARPGNKAASTQWPPRQTS